MENLNYEQVVKEAAKWLDGVEPGWHKKIDRETLQLASCSACVLGQLYGDFDIADNKFIKSEEEYDKGHWKAFCPDHIGGVNLANKLWLAEISARLEADKAKSADAFIAKTNEIINQPVEEVAR